MCCLLKMGTMRKASEHLAQLGLKEQGLSGFIWETHTDTHTLTQKPLKERNGPPRERAMEVRHRGREEDRSSKSRHYSSYYEGGTYRTRADDNLYSTYVCFAFIVSFSVLFP